MTAPAGYPSTKDFACWASLLDAAGLWLDRPTVQRGRECERLARKAKLAVMPPPHERARMEFWRQVRGAIEDLDGERVGSLIQLARVRFDIYRRDRLAAAAPDPEPQTGGWWMEP